MCTYVSTSNSHHEPNNLSYMNDINARANCSLPIYCNPLNGFKMICLTYRPVYIPFFFFLFFIPAIPVIRKFSTNPHQRLPN